MFNVYLFAFLCPSFVPHLPPQGNTVGDPTPPPPTLLGFRFRPIFPSSILVCIVGKVGKAFVKVQQKQSHLSSYHLSSYHLSSYQLHSYRLSSYDLPSYHLSAYHLSSIIYLPIIYLPIIYLHWYKNV